MEKPYKTYWAVYYTSAGSADNKAALLPRYYVYDLPNGEAVQELPQEYRYKGLEARPATAGEVMRFGRNQKQKLFIQVRARSKAEAYGEIWASILPRDSRGIMGKDNINESPPGEDAFLSTLGPQRRA